MQRRYSAGQSYCLFEICMRVFIRACVQRWCFFVVSLVFCLLRLCEHTLVPFCACACAKCMCVCVCMCNAWMYVARNHAIWKTTFCVCACAVVRVHVQSVCVCVCVCVCVRMLRLIFRTSVLLVCFCAYMLVCMYVYACVCKANIPQFELALVCMLCVYACMCVCKCMCHMWYICGKCVDAHDVRECSTTAS